MNTSTQHSFYRNPLWWCWGFHDNNRVFWKLDVLWRRECQLRTLESPFHSVLAGRQNTSLYRSQRRENAMDFAGTRYILYILPYFTVSRLCSYTTWSFFPFRVFLPRVRIHHQSSPVKVASEAVSSSSDWSSRCSPRFKDWKASACNLSQWWVESPSSCSWMKSNM